MNNDQIKEFRENGFIKISNVFNEQEIEKAKKVLISFASFADSNLQGKHISRVSGEVYSLHILCKHLKEDLKFLYTNEKIQSFIKSLLGPNPDLVTIEAFLKPAKSSGKTPLHQDDFYFHIMNHLGVNVWISLDGSTIDQGPVYYYKGSHKWGLCSHVSQTLGTFQFDDKQKIEQYKSDKVSVTTSPGDVVIHDVLTVHGSGENKTDLPRRAITLVFKDKGTELDMKRKNIQIKRNYLDIINYKKTILEDK